MLTGNLQLTLGTFELNSGEFSLPMQGVTVLFGRSGCGKSTLLRAIAGLDKFTRGSLKLGDEIWQQGAKALPASQRNIGFVFQDAALFPHLTVLQNLQYGMKRLPKDLKPADFEDIVKRVGIAHLLDRAVTFLSGGERQRVAIARALLMRPKMLCMDEPLSALDWRSKVELLTLIEEIIQQYQLPVLYITHMPAEVERLADRVVFMKAGQIERIESLKQALERPDSPLFDESGAVSVLLGQPGPVEDGLQQIAVGKDSLWVAQLVKRHMAQVRVRILARDVSLALSDPADLSIVNHLAVTIQEVFEQEGHSVLVRLRLEDGQFLFAEVTQKSAKRLQLLPGLVVFALIKTVALTD